MLVKKSLRIVTALSLLLALSFMQVFAATIGNDPIARTNTDTYSNFTIIDTNNSVQADGEITSFTYYAANTNPFSFVVVSSTNVVEYVSPLITPSGTGEQTYEPASPIEVSVGDNIGMYFQSTGTIPFDYVGDPAIYTPNNNGMPMVGDTLTVEGTSGRTYSLSATVRMAYEGENRSMGYYKNHGPLPTLPIRTCTTTVVNSVTSMAMPVAVAVTPGTEYTITASGTYDANDGIIADAKYSDRNNSGTWTDSVQNYEVYGPELLDLQVSADGTTFTSPDWGEFNPEHVYDVDYTTAADQSVLYFRINDIDAGNNTGSLEVELCSGVTKFTSEEIADAFKNYSKSAFNKFLTQYAVTLFNIQRDPELADAVYDSDTGSEFDGMTVAELAALAETYDENTPAADLLALKDVFDDINNNRFLYTY